MAALLLRLLLVAACIWSHARAACPSADWHASKGTCYRLIDHLWTWTDAMDACDLIQSGSTLAVVHDLEQNAFVAETVCGYNSAWLGLRRADMYEYWKWPDGSVTNFTQWGYNQPSGYGEQCALINVYTSGQWVSASCGSDIAYFVCQIPDE